MFKIKFKDFTGVNHVKLDISTLKTLIAFRTKIVYYSK